MAQHINDLPKEVLEEILSYLSMKEKLGCQSVCSYWQRINPFHLTKQLVFEGWEDTFSCQHKESIKEHVLPREANMNDHIMKNVLLKCGKHLRSFKGVIKKKNTFYITQHCPRLQCIDVELEDLESLALLCNKYSQQLTCLSLKINTSSGIKSLISACPNLISLAIRSPRNVWTNQSDTEANTLDLSYLKIGESVGPQAWNCLRNLVIQSWVSEEMLAEFMLFTNLHTVDITVRYWFTETVMWKSVMSKWTCLRSLTLEVVHENCADVSTLPPNLEYLFLKIHGMKYYYYDDSEPITFQTPLPKLRILKIYQFQLENAHLSAIFDSVLRCCPAVEEFSLDHFAGNGHDMEFELSPLFHMTSLRHLSLPFDFIVSYSWFAELLTELPFLVSFGQLPEVSQECLVPSGSLFWKALREKVVAHPDTKFNLTGCIKNTLCLHTFLPPNIYLCLMKEAAVKLSNGFANSLQWRDMTHKLSELTYMSIEIEDKNCNLNGLPKSLTKLKIKCLNTSETKEHDALVFRTELPILEQLQISHQNMTNQQLQSTLECVATFCPNLTSLCLDRKNESQNCIDDQLDVLLKCKSLNHLCITKNFVVSDARGAKLVEQAKHLRKFGCPGVPHYTGFVCGPMFLTALLTEALKGIPIVLSGGPTYLEVMQTIHIKKKPRTLHLKPFLQSIKDKAKTTDDIDDHLHNVSHLFDFEGH